MKIALIGAPGSGKSQLAESLIETFEKRRPSQEGSPSQEDCVVDGYVENIEKFYHIATGAAGTYIANLMILCERLGQEQFAQEEGFQNVITCGTLIDSAAYELVNADIAKQENIAMRAYNLMHIISTLIIDTWKYDHVFYLPLRDSEREFHKSLDVAIPEILAQTQCAYHAIVSDNQLEAALEVINADANLPV